MRNIEVYEVSKLPYMFRHELFK